jgi:hypothetical protein
MMLLMASQDGHPENKPTHIIFDSDGASEMDEPSPQMQSHPRKELVKVSHSRHPCGHLSTL